MAARRGRAFRVTVPAADEDLAAALLWEAGTLGPRGDGRAAATPCSSPTSPTGRRPRSRSWSRSTPCPSPASRTPPVPDVDWVARFREGFRAFDAGRSASCPAWDAGDARGRAPRSSSTPGRPSAPAPTRARGCAWPRWRRCARPRRRSAACSTWARAAASWPSRRALLGRDASRSAIEIDPEALPAAREHADAQRRRRPPRPRRRRARRPRRAPSTSCSPTSPRRCSSSARASSSARRAGPAATSSWPASWRDQAAAVRAAYAACAGAIDVRIDGEWAALVLRRAP